MGHWRPSKDENDGAFTAYDISIDIEWVIDVKGESSQWTVIVWLNLAWFDNRLIWNASEYNISKITVPGMKYIYWYRFKISCRTQTMDTGSTKSRIHCWSRWNWFVKRNTCCAFWWEDWRRGYTGFRTTAIGP